MRVLLVCECEIKMENGVMGLFVYIILILGVGIPLAQSVISTANLTGLTATVVTYIPVFLALAVLIAVARSAGM